MTLEVKQSNLDLTDVLLAATAAAWRLTAGLVGLAWGSGPPPRHACASLFGRVFGV